MKNWKYHFTVKTVAVLFAAVFLFLSIVSCVSVVFLLNKNGFLSSWERVEEKYIEEKYMDIPRWVAYQYASNHRSNFLEWLNWMEEEYAFRCKVTNEFGSVLFSDYQGEKKTYEKEETFYFFTDEEGNVCEGGVYDAEFHVTVYGYGPVDGSYGEVQLNLLRVCHLFRYLWIGGFFVSAALFILLVIFLCTVSGKREKDGEVVLGFWSRIPAELVLGFWAAFLVLQLLLLDAILITADTLLPALVITASFLAADCILCVFSVISLAIRIKSQTLWKNTLVYRFGKPVYRLLKRLSSFFGSLWEELRLEPKVLLLLAATAIFDFFLATVLNFHEFLAAILVEGLILSIILLWYAAAIQLLRRDLSHRVSGKLEYRSDLTRLPPGLRSFGEDLNRSAEGMEKALEEKMKSERFKTELITGVSHDIKTPLTSIINYVDLMKKEEVESETMREYLDVLDRQSHRLKKLTEDLVESSKAASGVLPVELAPLDVKVLMEQAQGEYQSLLEEKGLSPVFSLPEEPVFVLADGKRFWRVLDNLMNNIAKYALSGTRVYADLTAENGVATMTFRNISARPLPFTGEDLTEKFVRGDASRNTEGSGLGLAIAKSFVELQKGRFEVICDGDLFKVRIVFDIIK